MQLTNCKVDILCIIYAHSLYLPHIMKNLLLIRHAKSSWSDPSLADRDRPLNTRGKRDGPFMASYIRSKDLILDRLLSSPAKRAYRTAKFFAKEFNSEVKDFSKESDLYFGSESDWMDLINTLDEQYHFPAFFSHNPTITYFANAFIGNDFDNVPTCGVIHLRSSVDLWKDLHYDNTQVHNYYFPKHLQ